jgi:carbonic anhydrase
VEGRDPLTTAPDGDSKDLRDLLERNRRWSEGVRREDPEFFRRLASQHAPRYFWLGCSDSRLPSSLVTGIAPGEMFVHRNVANLFLHGDLNALSALQFAIERLGVLHVIVCGHYGCSGVRAAFDDARLGIVDNWIRPLRDLAERHRAVLATQPVAAKRVDRLCELNVVEQVRNVCFSTAVQDAWRAGRPLAVHGWIYGLEDGLIRDMSVTVGSAHEVESVYRSGQVGMPKPT